MNAAAFSSEPAACTLGPQGGDGPDRITQYTYDAASQLTQIVSALGTSAQKTDEKLGYEGDGHVSYVWDGNGNLTTNYWDGFGRLGLVRYPSPNSSGTSNSNDYVAYSYDGDNNVTSKRLRDGTTINLSFDARNNTTTGGDGSAYSYDNFGRRRSANYNGRNLSFAYDALGRMTSQTSNLGTLSYAYDAAGNRTEMVWPDGFAITFKYNANPTLQSFWEGSSPSGGYTPMSFYYDNQNRLSGLSWLSGVSAGIGYDAASRINSDTLNIPNSKGTTFNLNYNEASQAKSISNSNGLYDWPTLSGLGHSYSLNGLNQVIGNGPYNFGYDAKGNLTSDGVNNYSYDVLNRLTAGPNGVTLSYDALGRLASTTTSSGATTQYLYDGQNLVATYDGSGNVTSHYVFGQGTDQPVMWYNGSGTSDRRFLLANPQGSIIGVTDVNGNLLIANTYDEFGVPGTNNSGSFQYTGQLWLASAGLYYYKTRIYSPALGRFLQTDPIGYGDGPNWYNYAHGDPVNGSDPTGQDATVLAEVVVTAYPPAAPILVVAAVVDVFAAVFNVVDSLFVHVTLPKPQPAPQHSPCNTVNTNGSIQDRSNFFSHLSELQNVAKALNVPEDYIVGLSSYESGWLDTHNIGLHNLWGLTQAGGNNIDFSSFAAGDSYFISRVGPYIKNASTISDFEQGLRNEGYNSINPNYWSSLTSRINSIPKWEGRCGVH